MTFKEHLRKNMILALPVIFTQVGQIMVQVVDSIMVGHLGKQELASITLANSAFFIIIIVGIGFSFAISALVSEADSRKNIPRVQLVFSHGLFLNILLAIVLILIGIPAVIFLEYLQQDPQIIPDAKSYLTICLWSMLPIMIFQTLRQIAEGLSLTLSIAIATISANIVNVFFNYGLIYGEWGMPALGVDGAAIGSFISRVFMMIVLFWILIKNKKIIYYFHNFVWRRIRMRYVKKIISLGLPSALQVFFEISAFALAAIICGMTGEEQIAAHQIAINLAAVTFMFCFGFSVSANIRVGNQLGLKDFYNLRKAAYSNIFMALVFMCCTGLLFILFRHALPKIYTPDIELQTIAAQLLVIAALFQLFDGLQVTALGALRGLQDTTIPTWITFIAYYAITIPLGYYLAVVLGYKAYGMWIALGIGLSISASLLLMRFELKSKRYIRNK